MAPTTLPDAPPLEFIDAAQRAGFDGLGLRLHKSPAYPNWVDWLGDSALKREVKQRLADSGQEMVETLSYYLLPEMDWDEYRPSLEYARELGATYALIIGRDPDWSHQRDSFAQFCDIAADIGLIAAIEAPVGTLFPIDAAFRVIEETGKQNAVLCIDPTAFMRAGDTPATLQGRNPKLLPYTQLNDGKREGGPRVRPGDGEANVSALLQALPRDIPLSLEWPPPREGSYSAQQWASLAMEGTQRFLKDQHT
jgi:sugar phosphate isomerase/epimerase